MRSPGGRGRRGGGERCGRRGLDGAAGTAGVALGGAQRARLGGEQPEAARRPEERPGEERGDAVQDAAPATAAGAERGDLLDVAEHQIADRLIVPALQLAEGEADLDDLVAASGHC